MQTLILDQRAKLQHLQVLPEAWPTSEELLQPLPQSVDNLDEARTALNTAERVIRAQEERIRQLQGLALSDELTGLVNRRGLMLALRRELSAARRDAGANGTLVMIDLDGFKMINDLWGHAAGDDYLQAVAHALLSDVRASDIVARMGGDEFAVLFPRMDEETGFARVKKLEKSFNSRMLEWNRKPIPLRGSFGLSTYTGADTQETVMASADLKLYAHKARRAVGRR